MYIGKVFEAFPDHVETAVYGSAYSKEEGKQS